MSVRDAKKQMMRLTYEIPHGFSEEVRWFKFFPMRSLKALVCSAAPGVFLIRLFQSLKATVPFLVFWGFVVLLVTGSTMFPVPRSRWLAGGGEYVDQIVIKRYIRKRKRCLYIRGYDQLGYEEEERAK